MKNGLLVKYGEIALRGNNRHIFEKQLIQAIKKNIAPLGNYYVSREQGRFFIYNPEGNVDIAPLIERVKKIFGVLALCPCLVAESKDPEALETLVLTYFEENYGHIEAATFKAVCKRADKKFPMTSNEAAAWAGGLLLDKYPGLRVNLHKPEIIINMEIRNRLYVYSKIIPAQGGLPQGSSGKGILLLSGGLDSPVAGYLMEKRGVALEGLYFHSPPYTSERAREKVEDLAKVLASYTGGTRLNIINFTEIQLFLYDHVPPEKLTILLKRAMLKIGGIMAKKTGAQVLVTGDSVGQVASQTIKSIAAVESAVNIPIIRPLAAFEKQQIINLAQEIGTYNISIRPYEDCCTVFVAKHPETKPKISIIESIENRISDRLVQLIDKAVLEVETLEF